MVGVFNLTIYFIQIKNIAIGLGLNMNNISHKFLQIKNE